MFRYPRSIVAGCLVGLTQTGGVALALWMVTLFVMVLRITPPEASSLVIWISLAAVAGRFYCSWISDSMGAARLGCAELPGGGGIYVAAGYLHSVFIGGVSMFFVMILLQSFMGSGNYSIVGPYMGELWPTRLRGSGMGLVYGVGNLGKFIGPAGLALIAGSSNHRRTEGYAGRADPGVQLLCVPVCVGCSGILVHRHRDARPHDRGNRCDADCACSCGGVKERSGGLRLKRDKTIPRRLALDQAGADATGGTPSYRLFDIL